MKTMGLLLLLSVVLSPVEGGEESCFLAPSTQVKANPQWISISEIQNGTLLGEFQGGTSRVQRVLLAGGKRVAVKFTQPENQWDHDARPFFESEVFILKDLSGLAGTPTLHPLIPSDRVHPMDPYLGLWKGKLFMVLEDLGGAVSLAHQCLNSPYSEFKDKPTLLSHELHKLRRMAQWVHQASETLDQAHEKHITHLDLEPSNLIECRESLRVMDWGLAILWTDRGRDLLPRLKFTDREDPAVMGTPEYFPPEEFLRLEGKPADDLERAAKQRDFYALTQTFLVLLTGSYLYDARASDGRFHKQEWEKLKQEKLNLNENSLRRWLQTRERTRYLGEMHEVLIRFFVKALNSDPQQRFQSWDSWNRAFQLALNKERYRLLMPGLSANSRPVNSAA